MFLKVNLIIDVGHTCYFLIENVNIEHNDRIRLYVLHNSCSPGCYLVKGFGFTQKGLIQL